MIEKVKEKIELKVVRFGHDDDDRSIGSARRLFCISRVVSEKLNSINHVNILKANTEKLVVSIFVV